MCGCSINIRQEKKVTKVLLEGKGIGKDVRCQERKMQNRKRMRSSKNNIQNFTVIIQIYEHGILSIF